MSVSNQCRLCVNLCKDYESLYDNSGQPNDVYGISVKYFHPMFLNVEQAGGRGGHQRTVLCLECWHYILNFYKFQESILLTQTELLEATKEMSSNPMMALLNSDTNDQSNKLLKGNNDISESPLKAFVDVNSDPSNNVSHMVKDEPVSTILPTIVQMDVFSEMPSTSGLQLKILDSQSEIITSSLSKYSEEIVKREDTSSEDETEDDDEPVGYFTDGNVSNANTHKPDEIKIECSKLEKYEMECDDNEEEFLSEDDVNSKYSSKLNDEESASEGTLSCDGETILKRKRKSLEDFDGMIAETKPHLECVVCHQLLTFSQLQEHFSANHPKHDCHIKCCNLQLNSQSLIEGHIRSHHGLDSVRLEKKRSQNLPMRSTRLLDCLINHYEPDLKCGLCDEKRSDFGQLETHFSQSHPQESCHIVCCKRKLRSRHRIKEHINVHLIGNLYQCRICQMSQVTRAGLYSHMYQRHGVDLKESDIADNSLIGRVTYKLMDAFIAEWRPTLECWVCSETCTAFTALRAHFRQKHPQGPECYIECCRRKFYEPHQIEEHIIWHQDPMAFRCRQCNECLTSRPSLYNHGRLQHPLVDQGDEAAAVADVHRAKTIERKSLTMIDNSIAELQPQLPCHVCEETEPTFARLQKHFRLKHSGENFFIISCGQKFYSRHNYLIHLQKILKPTKKLQRQSRYEIDNMIAQWKPELLCDLCQKSEPTFTDLEDHFREEHPHNKFFISCCAVKFYYRCKFLHHQKRKKNHVKNIERNPRKSREQIDQFIAQWRPNLKCAKCSELCSTFDLLKEHFCQNHPKDECHIICCERKLKRRCDIERHIRQCSEIIFVDFEEEKNNFQ